MQQCIKNEVKEVVSAALLVKKATGHPNPNSPTVSNVERLKSYALVHMWYLCILYNTTQYYQTSLPLTFEMKS